jgi:hypothetical protein
MVEFAPALGVELVLEPLAKFRRGGVSIRLRLTCSPIFQGLPSGGAHDSIGRRQEGGVELGLGRWAEASIG